MHGLCVQGDAEALEGAEVCFIIFDSLFCEIFGVIVIALGEHYGGVFGLCGAGGIFTAFYKGFEDDFGAVDVIVPAKCCGVVYGGFSVVLAAVVTAL